MSQEVDSRVCCTIIAALKLKWSREQCMSILWIDMAPGPRH